MSDQKPGGDAAMADILASIRRIVAEEGQRPASQRPRDQEDVFELTPAMRVEAGAVSASAARPPRPTPVARPVEPEREGPPNANPDRSEAAAPAPAEPSEPLQTTMPTARYAPPASPRGDDRAEADMSQHGAAADGASAIDEAAVADIVRAVLRQEFSGAFGRSLTQQIRQLVDAEVARALAQRREDDKDGQPNGGA